MTTLTPHTVTRDGSMLEAYDFGAHLARWHVDGTPVIWCSPRARLDGSKAIRGGVPICFPWFADGPSKDLSPSHGPVRTALWLPDDPHGEEVFAWRLSSQDVEHSPGGEHLPGPFLLRHAVSLPAVPSPTLRLALEITATGTEPLRAEAALHTYLGVQDVRQVLIQGLEGCDYFDKVSGTREHQDEVVRIEGEVDRVYDRSGPVALEDVAGGRSIRLEPDGATQTVVWNPGADKAAGIADLGPDDWREFVCIETAATAHRALEIPAGETLTLACTIEVQPAGGPQPGVTR